MKRLFALCIVLVASMLLAGCRGSGSSAPPPSNVNIVAGDTSITVSWNMSPGVEYWVFYAAASDVTPQSCIALTGCKIIMKTVSPIVISGLANGTTYSFTVNGRINGGPGGTGSPSIQAIPRLAGAVWTLGSSMILASNMHAVTYGNTFVAAGTTSSLFSSTDGINWTPQTTINWGTTAPSPLPDLNAATYFNTNYLTVGAGGVILTSPDAVTWTSQTNIPAATPNLYAVTSNGAGGYVATGASGTILTSANAINWTAATNNAGTTTALYGVTYGNGMYVAVGAAGTLLTSVDGASWKSIAVGTPYDLRSVAYGIVNGARIFVALGNNGALVTSTDGAIWTATTISATQINAVTFGRQFIAVDNSGGTFTSPDGLIWTRTQTATSPLFAVTHGPFDYSAVGAGGANLHSM